MLPYKISYEELLKAVRIASDILDYEGIQHMCPVWNYYTGHSVVSWNDDKRKEECEDKCPYYYQCNRIATKDDYWKLKDGEFDIDEIMERYPEEEMKRILQEYEKGKITVPHVNKDNIMEASNYIYRKLREAHDIHNFEKLFQDEVKEISSFTFGGDYELTNVTLLFNNGIEFNTETGCLLAKASGSIKYEIHNLDEIAFLIIDYLKEIYFMKLKRNNPFTIV